MVAPVSQRCPRCGQWFMGSDCIGGPCLDCECGLSLPEHPVPSRIQPLQGTEPSRSESGGRGDDVFPAFHDLATALRELHDFATIDTHHRYEARSRAAFEKAAKLLSKIGY